jgi:hypothetical protein
MKIGLRAAVEQPGELRKVRGISYPPSTGVEYRVLRQRLITLELSRGHTHLSLYRCGRSVQSATGLRLRGRATKLNYRSTIARQDGCTDSMGVATACCRAVVLTCYLRISYALLPLLYSLDASILFGSAAPYTSAQYIYGEQNAMLHFCERNRARRKGPNDRRRPSASAERIE